MLGLRLNLARASGCPMGAGLALLLLAAGLSCSAAPVPDIPRRGGTMRLWSTTDRRSLDPAVVFDTDSAVLVKLLFRGLLDYDQQGAVIPDQAQEWTVSPDGKTYQFRLRPEVRFSHGREVEAEDYVFALERVLNPATGSPGQTYYLDILGAPEFAAGKTPHVAGLRAPERRTLLIELAKPSFAFRYVLGLTFASVVPRELVQRYGRDFQYHLTGSGPYRVSEWRRGVRWRFERNPYWQGEDAWVDAFDLMIGGESMVGAMMVEKGDIDWARVSVVEGTTFAREAGHQATLHRVNMAATQYLFMNTEMKPFDDVRVRQAVSYAVDKNRLLKLAGGFGKPASGFVPPAMFWSNPSLPRYERNPAKARALLGQAGFPNGFATELWYIQSRVIDARAAESIQQDLREVGIRVELRALSMTAFEVKVRTRRQVPCGIWGWVADYPDPGNFLEVLFNGARITDADCNNLAFYRNADVDRLLEQANRAQGEERLRLYRETERLILEDVPCVPLIHEQFPVLRHPRVQGDMWHPVWLWRFEKVWLNN